MASNLVEKGEGQLQVHLCTKQPQYAVPDIPYSIGANVTISELNTLVNTLLQETSTAVGGVEFDFLIRQEFLRSSLGKHLRQRDISFEDVIEVEYIERFPAPEPQDCLLHDDWVSAIEARDNFILTGCYDNTLNLWTLKGKHLLTIPGHGGPIKGVSWISLDEQMGVFASASQDQTAMIWEWNIKQNSVDCVQICKGHERGVDCVDVLNDKMATGSWDNMLKVWSTSMTETEGESSSKRMKTGEAQTRTPILTLEGHREVISAVQWMNASTLLTASWDHTFKIWDLNVGGIKNETPGNKSFFDIHYSPLSGLILTASPDKNIRLYDPRSNQGSVVKNTYLGHSQWVQSVRWSTTEEFNFISGAYDNQVKLWDSRSPKAPLYDLIGHEDKVLACDWSNPKYMMSGGSDNSVRLFKSKKYAVNE